MRLAGVNCGLWTMIVDLKRLAEKHLLFEFSLGGVDTGEFDGVSFESPIVVKGELTEENKRVTVVGSVRAACKIDCSRCLEAVEHPLDFKFRAVYITPEEFGSEKELELSAADMDADVMEGESLDLAVIAREHILLELPTRFLCRDDCRGICEQCGENRNLIDCNCVDNESDPRWEALRKLK